MKHTHPVFVFGAGGHAKVVVATLIAAGHRVGGLYDDDAAKRGRFLLGHPVLGTLDDVPRDRKLRAVAAVGDNLTRARVVERLPDVEWITVVHPNADVHSSVELGAGTAVFSGAVIQPDTIVGSHGIVNTAATVDHDSVLGDYVHVAPGCHLAGETRIEEGAFLGIGSVGCPGVSIGAWATVAAGAVVVDDIPPRVTAIGVPARPCRKKDPHEESDSDGVPRSGRFGHSGCSGSPPIGSARTRTQD